MVLVSVYQRVNNCVTASNSSASVTVVDTAVTRFRTNASAVPSTGRAIPSTNNTTIIY